MFCPNNHEYRWFSQPHQLDFCPVVSIQIPSGSKLSAAFVPLVCLFPSIYLTLQMLCCWTKHKNFSTKCFYTCLAYELHWPLPIYTTFWWLRLWLTFTRTGESKPPWVHNIAQLQLIKKKFWCDSKRFKLNILIPLFKEICVMTGIAGVLLVKCIQTFINWFGSNFACWQMLLNSAFWDYSRWPSSWLKTSHGARTQKLLCQLYHKVVQSSGWNVPLKLVNLMTLIHIGFCPINIQKRQPYLGDLIFYKI